MRKSAVFVLSVLLVLAAIVSFSIPSLPEEAKGNRWELCKVLWHYRWIDRDAQKYEAARFLIDNMPYHRGKGRLTYVPEGLKKWRKEADSLYASVRLSGMEEKDWRDSIRKLQKARWALLKDSVLPEAEVDAEWFEDIQQLSCRFLTDHIDNAFRMWHQSVFAKGLTFDEFKEYLLPYRSVGDYGFHLSGKEWQEWFGKYIPIDGTATLKEAVRGYNQAINNVQELNGASKRKVPAGAYDLYAKGVHDCVDIANYGCNVLRACGLPVVVEYNMSYRTLQGRHYHCNVWYDAKEEWRTFNPQSSLPGDRDWAFAEVTNVYRMTYGAQKDTPYFLKNEGEYVPALLDDPCIIDVTSDIRETVPVTLPCDVPPTNRLAYLATFHKESGGLIAVTWGEVNHDKKSVTFKNVLPGTLYFPLYYVSSNEIKTIGEPFYVRMKDKQPEICALSGVLSGERQRGTIVVQRKYPRKPKMIKVAENLVGSRFLGANKRDFSDAVVLYEIKEPPLPYFLEYPLTKTGKFLYYRFQTTKEHPNANISMLEWIASSKHGYTNVMPPTRIDILAPEDTLCLQREKEWVKLLDASWGDTKWKAEYDGKMQTAPGAYPNITLWLKEPQVVSRLRFAPLNADNGIHGGEKYRLYYWEDGWKVAGTSQATYEYIIFHDVPQHKLYWLENLTTGKEEMPFVMIDGKQRFFYE